MNPISFQSVPLPPPPGPPRFPILRPELPNSSSFWENRIVSEHLRELQDTLNLAKAMQKELEMLMMIQDGKGSSEDVKHGSDEPYLSGFLKCLEDRRVNIQTQESLAVEAANSLISKLRAQLEPFRYVADEASPWEEKSAVARFVNRVHKSKRNKLWRRKKRKRTAEILAKEHEQFDRIDQEANEWRAREIAKDLANSKVEKMRQIAKLKAKEEKKLQSELELLLVVEKLQELRYLRIQKLKKQGHFFPEEDDKFIERVQDAVEEEEREAMAAAETDAAKEAIATAEESRKAMQNQGKLSKGSNDDKPVKESRERIVHSVTEEDSGAADEKKYSKIASEGQSSGGAYDPLANLPIEFYHYYHGSNNDMGTLIEVRRGWDAYIRPGGSRIPGQWVQPPPPANEIWASYLVRPK